MRFDLGPQMGHAYLDVLDHVLQLVPEDGYALEFGVASGRSLALIAQRLKVVGFDSFEGLPEDWRDGFPRGMFACKPPQIANASIVIGLFDETLPRWFNEGDDPLDELRLVHIDCDLYSSTATVLEHVGPRLLPGTYVVFDEFHGYPGCEDHEQRAWSEFIAATGRAYDVVGHGPEQWAVRIR